jgi:Tfp pilus assembly PilM family ATPase
MKFFPGSRLTAGIEISSGEMNAALLVKKNKEITIRTLAQVAVPAGTLKPSFKMENIVDEPAFIACLEKCRDQINFKKTGVALPDAAVKVQIKEFNELPRGTRDIQELMLWTVSRSLNLDADTLRVSWKNMGRNLENKYVIVITLGLEAVLGQYEEVLKRADINPVMLAPGGLKQFDFYSRLLPQTGRVAYFGLFDAVLNIFVFDNGIPIFYRLMKKGFLNKENGGANGSDRSSAVDHIDLLIQYFDTEHPDFKIDRLYIASPLKSEIQVKQIFQDMGDIPFTIMDEGQLIRFEAPSDEKAGALPFFSGALGAAMGFGI